MAKPIKLYASTKLAERYADDVARRLMNGRPFIWSLQEIRTSPLTAGEKKIEIEGGIGDVPGTTTHPFIAWVRLVFFFTKGEKTWKLSRVVINERNNSDFAWYLGIGFRTAYVDTIDNQDYPITELPLAA